MVAAGKGGGKLKGDSCAILRVLQMHLQQSRMSWLVAALLAKDARAAVVLKHIADLYRIESDCKKRVLDADARGEERRRRSLPILEQMQTWTDETIPSCCL